MWYPFRKKKRNGYTTFDWERLEERRPGEMQTEGGDWERKNFFQKREGIPFRKARRILKLK